MGYYSGSSGTIKYAYASTPEAESSWVDTQTKVTNWTMTTSAQLLTTTTLGDYDKTSVYGLPLLQDTKAFTIEKLEHSLIQQQTAEAGSSISWNDMTANQLPPEVRLRLYVDDKNNTTDLTVTDYVELNANITSISYGSNIGELVAVDVSFEATGPVTSNKL